MPPQSVQNPKTGQKPQTRPNNADFRARRGQNYERREKPEKRTILPQSLPSRRHGPPRGAERSGNGFLARHFRKNSDGRDSKGGNFVLGKMGGVKQSPQNMRRIRRPIAVKPKIAQKTAFEAENAQKRLGGGQKNTKISPKCRFLGQERPKLRNARKSRKTNDFAAEAAERGREVGKRIFSAKFPENGIGRDSEGGIFVRGEKGGDRQNYRLQVPFTCQFS